MAEVNLTEDNFANTISEGLTIVDFWAVWCGPCQRFAPVFADVSKQYPEITFGKVNVDEQSEIAQQYGIMSIPTLKFFRDGKEIDTVIGAIDKNNLIEKIQQITES